MTDVLLSAQQMIWGVPMLLLILGVGLRITLATGAAQLRLFPAAVRCFLGRFRSRKAGTGVSPFRALCTALGATVGTGNIIGVAGAICLGGPGAVFWMWLCGFVAMGTKFAEATLAVRYRCRRGREALGGPMYMILHGLGSRYRPLARLYCAFGLLASFGVGNMAQVNAVISGINSAMAAAPSLRRNLGIGLILAVLVGSVLVGGAKRIGSAAELLVPAVSALYILLCLWALYLRRQYLFEAILAILRGAFSPAAVTGGAVGSWLQALRVGCCRGVFTNEAGMGTASMAHGAAEVAHPVEQGLLGIIEVFLDTIVICTLTALVILTGGIAIPFGVDGGGTLTAMAFAQVCGGWSSVVLAAALCLFAFATVLGWGLYGGGCAGFLFGGKSWGIFAAAQTGAVVLGAVLNTETIWLLAELFNGLMAIPNLIALAALTPELGRLTIEYKNKSGGTAAEGGYYADFHQCQPLRTLSHEKISSLRGGGGKAGKEDLSLEHRSA